MAFGIGDVFKSGNYLGSQIRAIPQALKAQQQAKAANNTYNQNYNAAAAMNYLYGPVNPSSPYYNTYEQTKQFYGTSTQTPPPTTTTPPPSPTTTSTVGNPTGTRDQQDAYAQSLGYKSFDDMNDVLRQQEEQQRLQAQVDSAYSDAYSELNNIEAQQRAGEQTYYESIAKPYEAQIPLLNQGLERNKTTNAAQVNDVKQREANALSDARRLFDELRQGQQQRFGGGSSTGEFANAFLGREQQRQSGNIRNTAGQDLSRLQDNFANFLNDYNYKLQNLELEKAAAIAQAKNEFSNRLMKISSARVDLGVNKAQAKLQALQELRNKISNYNLLFAQNQQNLQAQLASANLNLRNAILGYREQAGTQIDLNQYQIYNPLAKSYTQAPQDINPMGQFSPTKRRDPLTGQLIG